MTENIKADISGVYLIQCIENGKNYIGSAKCIRTRWKQHIRDLNKKIHHNIKLQKDWDKYKEHNFIFSVLIECTHSDSKKYELEYIKKFNSEKFGYNIKKLKESTKSKDEYIEDLILDYVKQNQYKHDENMYWYNIFKLSNNLNMGVLDILKFFNINHYQRWDISFKTKENIYIGISYNEDGVQLIAYSELCLNKINNRDYVNYVKVEVN